MATTEEIRIDLADIVNEGFDVAIRIGVLSSGARPPVAISACISASSASATAPPSAAANR